MSNTKPSPEKINASDDASTLVAADTIATTPPDGGAAEHAHEGDLAAALQAAQQKAQEHHDNWLRAKAETENLRRRAQEDVAKAHKFASEKFAGELLAVKDSLEAALTSDSQSFEDLKNGVEVTLRQLCSAFDKANVKEVSPLNEKFDPHQHQAISQIDGPAGTESNTVLQVLQKGYVLNERILRPALVIVAR